MSSSKVHDQPILLVVDNAEDGEMLRSNMGKYAEEFPNVVCVSDVADAIWMVRDIEPACCLLDCRAEHSSSLTLLKQLRQDYPAESLPIVVVVEDENEELAMEALRSGAQNYLYNDEISPARLTSALSMAIRSGSMQRQLTHLSHYDSLTGLLNRSLLMNRLEQAVRRCDRYKQRSALLCLDVKNFQSINDSYGHEVGDALLQAVGERVRRSCRSTDSAARIAGDEFVVLLEQVESGTGRKVADKLLKSLSAPFEILGNSVMIGASMGLAVYPDTAKSVDELMKQAHQAMNRAKESEVLDFVSFSEQHQHQWRRRHTLECDLPGAIARGDLQLVYQPIVTAKGYKLRRLEVLSRWPREDYAVGAPELMELIDRLNLIEPFHEWLFNKAFGQLRKWQDEGISLNLCLNIPANYCYNRNISLGIRNALTVNGVNPQAIELEITESTLMRFPEKSIQVLHELRDYGLRIAVDDFGTGYSSMAYLTSLPLDTLKIDKHFFLDAEHHERNRKIIEGIAALGHSLDLEIIAEGVETNLELALAKSAGCDLLQGYYFGRPQFPGESWDAYISQFHQVQLDS